MLMRQRKMSEMGILFGGMSIGIAWVVVVNEEKRGLYDCLPSELLLKIKRIIMT